MYRKWGKRCLDLTVSVAALLVLSPVFLAIIAAAAFCNGGKVFFLQERPGKNGRPFRIYKLKTMLDAFDADGKPLPDEERLTAFGYWVRRLSLDELFQLVNVVKGEMSLIGPRPLLMQYLPLYSPYEARRHDVLPGISGLAQIRGRNNQRWRDRFRYDVFYCEHVSAGFDLWIAWQTVCKIVRADDIVPAGMTVAEHTFRGSSAHGSSAAQTTGSS